MSLYKGNLHVIESETDGHRIDEVEQLRAAVDHLARYLVQLTGDTGGFDPAAPRDLAETISNLSEMIRFHEEQRENEPAQAVRS